MNFTLTSASITGVSKDGQGMKFTLRGIIDADQLDTIGFGQGLGPYKAIERDYSGTAEQHIELVDIDDDHEEFVINEGDITINSCKLTRDETRYVVAFKITGEYDNQVAFWGDLITGQVVFPKVDIDGGVVELPMKHDHELPETTPGKLIKEATVAVENSLTLSHDGKSVTMAAGDMAKAAARLRNATDERETVLTGKGGK